MNQQTVGQYHYPLPYIMSNMNIINLKTSEEFKKWWFSLPLEDRRTLNIGSCVAAWNAAKSKSDE